MSCISTYDQANNIFTCHISMVSHYLSRYFVIYEANRNELNNIPIEVKTIVHSIDKHNNRPVISYKRIIPHYCNTMNEIYFTPTYCINSNQIVLITMLINSKIFSKSSFLFASIILNVHHCFINEKNLY